MRKTCGYYLDFGDMGESKEYIWFINVNVFDTRIKALPGYKVENVKF